METKFEDMTEDKRIVYVKAIDVVDLPSEVREHADGLEHLYAVHDEDGQQLALVANRGLAFQLARAHDLSPVAVH